MSVINCYLFFSLFRSSTASSSYASMSPCQKNKVRVYVPYSTLIALTNEIRETPVDDLDDEDVEDILEQVTEINSSSIGTNDLVICDTQVILRINPDQQNAEIQYSTCKRNNRRMTRKLLNESETFHKITGACSSGNSVQGAAGTGTNLNLPRRKDLCKLLGKMHGSVWANSSP